jgi:CRISPR-associated protein Csd1
MTVLQSLYARYERLAARGDLPKEGYSTERISFAVVLSPEGEPLRVRDLRRRVKNRDEGKPLAAPQSFKRPGVTPRAFFLWDNSKFALGVGVEKGGKAQTPYPKHFEAFQELHRRLLGETDDPGLMALLRFLDQWREERFDAAPFSKDMLEANIVFMLDGDKGDNNLPRYLHDRPVARRIWERQVAGNLGKEGLCLVTGENAPIAVLHPAIKGVMGAQSSGASIVSFNQDSFESYGKEQGANAPVSQAAANGYGAALNAMLAGTDNRLQIADSTMVFWADSSDRALEERFREMADPPDDEAGSRQARADAQRDVDGEETQPLKDALSDAAKGRTLREIAPDLNDDTKFYVLGLAPNMARLSVRFWLESAFGELERRFREHWADTRIDPWPWKTRQPSIRALLVETALLREFKNVPANLGGELMRAVLTGGRYPQTLLSSVIIRIRADREVTGRRAAICRACIVRDLRIESQRPKPEKQFPQRLNTDKEKEDYLVSLDREEKSPGYLLGRLFAVLESAQYAALGKINATIRDRYYGAASATPAAVFPLLLRTSAHHIAVLRKDKKGGWVDKEIEEILGNLENPEFPRSLSIEQQGRFAIGYYHQRAYRKPVAEDAAETTETTSATEEAEG